MTPVASSNTTATTTAAATTGANAFSSNTIEGTQDRFLKLLVAQMRNQDPLNPLQNSEVTSQLAQLSTVTGINKLSELVGGLSNSFNQAQSLQATSVIGRGVLVEGKSIELTQGAALAAVELPQAVDQLNITIRNSAGAVVHTANLGPQTAGPVKFQWDGINDSGNAVTDGRYSYEAQGVAAGQAVSGITHLAYGRVNSVTLGAQGAQLNVDGLGAINLSQVKQVL